MHPLGVVPEATVECFASVVVLETPLLSLSCSEATCLGLDFRGRSGGIGTGGGTLSAPTGCSPRDYGGLLAVDRSLSIYCLCCFFFTEIVTPPL